jgi:hypothetical protein
VARVVAVVPDLLFGSRIQATLTAAGHDVELGADPDPTQADVVVVDLMADNVDVETLAKSGPPTLGFFAHVQPEVRERALAAGFTQVVPRSRMAREMADLVAALAGERG